MALLFSSSWLQMQKLYLNTYCDMIIMVTSNTVYAYCLGMCCTILICDIWYKVLANGLYWKELEGKRVVLMIFRSCDKQLNHNFYWGWNSQRIYFWASEMSWGSSVYRSWTTHEMKIQRCDWALKFSAGLIWQSPALHVSNDYNILDKILIICVGFFSSFLLYMCLSTVIRNL